MTTPSLGGRTDFDRSWVAFRPLDAVALAFTLAFVGWVAFGWGGEPYAGAINFAFYLPVGLAVGWMQLKVARALDDRRERLGWILLAAASFSRFVSGNTWSALLLLGRDVPGWLVVLASFFLFFGNAALLAFPSARLRRVDRVRFGIDGLIVLTGSVLMVWFFAIVPLQGAASAGRDYLYTISDTLALVLSAVLYLRSSSRLARELALFLLVAYLLQIVPDVLLRAPELKNFRIGSPLEFVWFSIWVIKWVAARRALYLLGARREASTASPPEYRSGALPFVFAGAAAASLLVQLVGGHRTDILLLLYGSGTLAALLVVRQLVELREHDHLNAGMAREAAWYGAVMEHAYDVLALVDVHSRLAFASPATQRLLPEDAVGQHLEPLLGLLHPDDAERIRALFAQRPFAPTVLALRLRTSEGPWRDLDCRFTDLRDDPLVAAVVINGHDVTREGQLTRRLREAEAVEALGVFAGGLAHDLNNFLAVVGSHVELLRTAVPASRPAAAADVFAMHVATQRATALTSGLLTLSRRKTESRVIVDFGALVTERLRSIETSASLTLAPGALMTRADPIALRHAVDALLHEQLAGSRTGAPPPIAVCIEAVGDADAQRLELTAGRYLLLCIGGGTDALALASLEPPRASDSWESAPDDLGALLVHAAVRETGGALAVDPGGTRPLVVMFLPEAAS